MSRTNVSEIRDASASFHYLLPFATLSGRVLSLLIYTNVDNFYSYVDKMSFLFFLGLLFACFIHISLLVNCVHFFSHVSTTDEKKEWHINH
jgi:hypothetical protein